MYRYESDYIMRMIHLLRLLHEHLLGVTDQDRLRSGEDEIRETMGKLVGVTPDAALTLNLNQLADMLGDDGEGLSRRYALAEMLRMQGEMYESLAFPEDGERSLRRAMGLYLLCLGAPDPLEKQALPPAQELFRRFFAELSEADHAAAARFFEGAAAYPYAEDAYCAMQDAAPAEGFYRRMLALPPEQLARGDFTRDEAQEGLVRILALQKDAPRPAPARSRGDRVAGADRGSYLAPVVAQLVKEWPDNRTVNIVCHGHSVPAGYFQTPVVDSFHAYPHLLHRALKERFPFAVINVIVSAVGGETSREGAARFEREALGHAPDVVTIDYGLNDRRIGLEAAEAAWRGMIEAALREGCRVMLLTPSWDDTQDKPGGDWAALEAHAEQIRALSEDYGVALCDSFALFGEFVGRGVRLADLLSQGNHPGERGHRLIADELAAWFPPRAEGRHVG